MDIGIFFIGNGSSWKATPICRLMGGFSIIGCILTGTFLNYLNNYMETLEQAMKLYAPDYENMLPGDITTTHFIRESFKAGAEWQKEQCAELVREALNKFQTAVKLLDTLVYYSNLGIVRNVCPANMITHDEARIAAQKWLHENCHIKDGEYLLLNPE